MDAELCIKISLKGRGWGGVYNLLIFKHISLHLLYSSTPPGPL